jgi:hypothetical protein
LEVAAVNEKPFAVRLADFVRRLGTDSDGEFEATAHAIRRFFKAHGVSFTDFGNAIETGGLEDDAKERIFDGGYQKGVEDTERKYAEILAACGLNLDGSLNFAAIVSHLRQNIHLIADDKGRNFVDDVASRVSWGVSRPQGAWLLSIFYRATGWRIR